MHSTRSASDKVYQLLAYSQWFSPGTPASSITKTGRHDIAKILLKVALNTENQNQNQIKSRFHHSGYHGKGIYAELFFVIIRNHKSYSSVASMKSAMLMNPRICIL